MAQLFRAPERIAGDPGSNPGPGENFSLKLTELLPSSIRVASSAYLNLLELIALTISGERVKLWSSSLWSHLHLPFSSLLGKNTRFYSTSVNKISYQIIKYVPNPFLKIIILSLYPCQIIEPESCRVYQNLYRQLTETILRFQKSSMFLAAENITCHPLLSINIRF